MLRGLIGVMSLVSCGTSADPEPTWQLIHGDDASALLAVWGPSSNDVWVVGGRASLTGGPAILHYDGAAWSRVDSKQSSLDLWWVVGVGDDVLFSGSGGTILRYHAGEFQRLNTPSMTGTIYGIWAAAPDDIWAVGDAGTAGGVVWHSSDGQTFTAVAIPDPVPSRVFKVHGQASNDVWMSCASGVTLHWNGSEVEHEQTPTTNSLFSIVTTPQLAVTVGGTGGVGALFEHGGAGWTPGNLEAPAAWRGTAAMGSDVAIVGENGLIARRVDSGWSALRQQLTNLNFHSAWLDEDHGLWAVGGLFEGRLSDGVLLYYGAQAVAEVAP
jgi:hypothetical protein